MKLKILDRYLLKELAGPFFFGIAAFSSVFIGTDVLFRMANYIAKYGAPFWSVIKLFLVSLPEIIRYTLPMSVLLSALLTFGRLSSTSEIIAMRAGGISFLRLMRPVVAVALIVTVVAFLLGEYVVPASRVAYKEIVRVEVERNTKPLTEEHIVMKVVSNGEMQQLIYARKFDEEKGRLEDVIVEDFEGGDLVRLETAEYATFKNGRWTIFNGVITELSPEGIVNRTVTFNQQELPALGSPREIAIHQKKPRDMNLAELRQQITALKQKSDATSKLKLELYQRYALPFACLMCALIGAPLGLQPQRSSSSMGFGLSVIIVLIYYVFLSVFTSLGETGKIAPLLAAWLPNLIGFTAGGFFIWKASR